jgi:hypothetical protein
MSTRIRCPPPTYGNVVSSDRAHGSDDSEFDDVPVQSDSEGEWDGKGVGGEKGDDDAEEGGVGGDESDVEGDEVSWTKGGS